MLDLREIAEQMWQNRREKKETWMPLIQTLMAEFQKLEQPTNCEKGYHEMGKALLFQMSGEYERAKGSVALAQRYFAQCDVLIWQARCAMNRAFLHVNLDMISDALSDWERAYRLGLRLADRETIITALYSIAIAHRVHLERYEDAISHFEQVLALCLQSDPPFYLTGNVYSGLSKCHMSLGHLDEAQSFANLALHYAKAFGDAKTLGWSLELCTSTAIALGELDKAKLFCEENTKQWTEIQDPYGLAIAYQNEAKLNRLKGDLQSAIQKAKEAIAIGLKLNSALLLEPLYLELSQLYEMYRVPQEALSAYKQYMFYKEIAMKAAFNREISKASTELRVENYRLKHVALQEKIDALKEAQDALVRSEKMNALLGLVAGVAHEINTPLGNSMTLNSYALEACLTLNDQINSKQITLSKTLESLKNISDVQNRIESNLRSVSNIVESFKRIGINTQPPNMHKRDVCDLLKGWQMALKLTYPKLKYTLHVKCPPHFHCLFDMDETIKVLDELFLNAITHGYPLSQTDLAKKETVMSIEILDAPRLSFVFRDWGDGIADALLPRVFEPFVRGNSEEKRLGMGLHVLYNTIAFRFGGSITIESTLGQGTAISVCF